MILWSRNWDNTRLGDSWAHVSWVAVNLSLPPHLCSISGDFSPADSAHSFFPQSLGICSLSLLRSASLPAGPQEQTLQSPKMALLSTCAERLVHRKHSCSFCSDSFSNATSSTWLMNQHSLYLFWPQAAVRHQLQEIIRLEGGQACTLGRGRGNLSQELNSSLSLHPLVFSVSAAAFIGGSDKFRLEKCGFCHTYFTILSCRFCYEILPLLSSCLNKTDQKVLIQFLLIFFNDVHDYFNKIRTIKKKA